MRAKATVFDRLAEAYSRGGFLAQVPGWDGYAGLGVAGITGVPQASPWDAVASAVAPQLPGERASFVVLRGGRIVGEPALPVEALEPLAASLAGELEPPYCAVAVRNEGDVWAAAATRAEIVELVGCAAAEVELSGVDGRRELRLDGEPSTTRLPELEQIADGRGQDVALLAHRPTGHVYVVDVFPL